MTTPSLPADAGDILLPLARLSIARALGQSLPPAADNPAPWLQMRAASFVTLHHAAQLRGRTGSLEPQRPLRDDISENAVRAALHDPCFSPLTAAELDGATIEIAVLSDLEPVAAANERAALAQLRAGIDGAVFRYGHHRSNFLPEMWTQYSDPAEFLAYLKYKSGLPPDFWDADIELRRYTVSHWREA
ncbi:MAG: AmmeMemoRadiSam system protein A [Burkholderiales bacterium]